MDDRFRERFVETVGRSNGVWKRSLSLGPPDKLLPLRSGPVETLNVRRFQILNSLRRNGQTYNGRYIVGPSPGIGCIILGHLIIGREIKECAGTTEI